MSLSEQQRVSSNYRCIIERRMTPASDGRNRRVRADRIARRPTTNEFLRGSTPPRDAPRLPRGCVLRCHAMLRRPNRPRGWAHPAPGQHVAASARHRIPLEPDPRRVTCFAPIEQLHRAELTRVRRGSPRRGFGSAPLADWGVRSPRCGRRHHEDHTRHGAHWLYQQTLMPVKISHSHQHPLPRLNVGSIACGVSGRSMARFAL